MTTDTQDVEALVAEMRAGLEGVTPGGWLYWSTSPGQVFSPPPPGAGPKALPLARERDWRHVARCSPDNIAKLLDHIDALALVARYEADMCEQALQSRSSLEAQLAGAKEALGPIARLGIRIQSADDVELTYSANTEGMPTITVGHLRRARAVYEALASAPAAREGMDPPVDQQRDILAQAIRDAAVKAGIARADASMTGPMLLMLCEDLANAATPEASHDR